MNDEVRDIWNAKAAFWNERMGDGNAFQRVLIAPAVERLLQLQPDEMVLDAGCGNGVFARRLAALGARVVAFDYSERFIELARGRSAGQPDETRIDYRIVDATDSGQLTALGPGRFNAVVCNMVLMDMPTIDPLIQGIARLLAPGGRFVFAVPHPAFNSNAASLIGERGDDPAGTLIATFAAKVTDYLHVPAGLGCGMPGEPLPHWYFHRPLHELFGACFAAGFVLNGLEEPAFPPGSVEPDRLSWDNLPGIPPVLAARWVIRNPS